MTLEDYLEQDAQLYPEKTAVVCGEESLTYSQLHGRVEARSRELKATYRKGQIVTLRAQQTADFLVEYFALHRAGCVAAPLEKNTPDDLFCQISQWLAGHEAPDGAADVLYTTGTTGRPKGVIVSHSTIVADAENLIGGQGFSHELAFVINGPLNHIGSLSKVYPVILLGATLIITDGLRDVNGFFSAFDYPASKFATFLVPASIRILIQFSSEQLAGLREKLDFLETGAAAIAHDDMVKLCQLLPDTRMYNTYASTETGIICTYDFNNSQCMAGCLGRPMQHSQVLITEAGLIACKGDTLMMGYIGEPERTAEVLRDHTLYTQDIGMIDEEGRLHLTGREGDVINVGGFKVAPTEVEDAALSFPGVSDCICIAVKHPITGLALKLLVVMADGQSLNKRELAQYLKTKLELYKIPMLYESVESVKRTYNGKLDRKFYAESSS